MNPHKQAKNKHHNKQAKQNKTMAFGAKDSFFQVQNANTNDEATIFVYDEIGGWGIWAVDFIWQLSRITAKTIRVRVHCDGGWVTEAIAMHNALRKHPAHIIMEVDSIAASAATFFIQAGDERVMAENAQLMFHDVQGGVQGTEAEIRAYADYIPIVRDAIVATYDYRTNITADAARELLTRGTDVYLNAQEALDMGFIDRIETLADMGEPPQGFEAEPSDPSNGNMGNKLSNQSASLNELHTIYGLIPQNNSVGPRQQDKGKTGEIMDKNQLIAQLKAHDIDVSALQTATATLTNERDTAQNKLTALQSTHDALKAAAGGLDAAGVTQAIATAAAFKADLMDGIITNKRQLNLCGDSDEAVKAEKDMLNSLSIDHLQGQAKTFAAAASGSPHSMLQPGQTGEDSNVSAAEAIARRIAGKNTSEQGAKS